MKLIVGLGNPGIKYKNTRHNLGFQIMDALSKEFKIKLNERKFHSVFGIGKPYTQKTFRVSHLSSVILVKPLTFMNNSGQAVKELIKNYHINLKDLIVICDDFNLDIGIIRIRTKGSSGGHNGLNSIIHNIGTKDFTRLRIGIGIPIYSQDPAVYVLNMFAKGEGKVIQNEVIPLVCEAVETMIFEGVESSMNKYNKKTV